MRTPNYGSKQRPVSVFPENWKDKMGRLPTGFGLARFSSKKVMWCWRCPHRSSVSPGTCSPSKAQAPAAPWDLGVDNSILPVYLEDKITAESSHFKLQTTPATDLEFHQHWKDGGKYGQLFWVICNSWCIQINIVTHRYFSFILLSNRHTGRHTENEKNCSYSGKREVILLVVVIRVGPLH